MISKRILLVGEADLFISGLENLLTKRSTQPVLRLDSADTDTLVAEIWQNRPDTVILNTLNFRQPLDLLACLSVYPALQLIILNEYNNNVVIYEHKSPFCMLSFQEKPKEQFQFLN